MTTRRHHITTRQHVLIPQNVDVSLSDRQVFELTEQMIRQQAGLKSDYYLRDGKVVHEWEEYGGSHSWSDSKVIREATSLDLTAFALLESLWDWQRRVLSEVP